MTGAGDDPGPAPASVSVRIGVAVKAAPRHVDVDPLTARVDPDRHPPTLAPADQAAIETALRLAEAWDGAPVTVASVAGTRAEDLLREALSLGATRAVRVPPSGGTVPGGADTLRSTARALAAALGDCAVIVCGDASVDGGTGAVPALLAAELGRAQCLGLVAVTPGPAGEVTVQRRLDGGRRERARSRAPMVLSVEPGAARPRRAPLPAVLAARAATIDVRPPVEAPAASAPVHARPYRPRSRVVPAPDPSAPPLDRVEHLVGALTDRDPPRRVDTSPAEAAREIVDQLTTWGYL